MNEKDVIMAASGRDELGNGKSLLRLEAKRAVKYKDSETDRDIFLEDKVVNVFIGNRFTTVDIEFDDEYDVNFIGMRAMLYDFSDAANSMDPESGEIPFLLLTLMPKECMGEYFVCGMDPAWSLVASKPLGKEDTVRFIFDNNFIGTFEVDEDLIEKEEGETEIV